MRMLILKIKLVPVFLSTLGIAKNCQSNVLIDMSLDSIACFDLIEHWPFLYL